METTQFAKQALGFQKTMFDNSFNAMTMVQDQTEKMVNGYLDQLPWVTAEGKNPCKLPSIWQRRRETISRKP